MFAHPDYTVTRTLGRGGSATVYLAVQKSLNRQVALKVLHCAALLQEGSAARFLREARTVAKLSHPHIVPVYEVGPEPDGPGYYMAMEYLRCGTLLQLRNTLTLTALLRVIQQVASALAFSHEQGFVHRDVKSDNILFRTPSEAVLTDFGIARLTESLTRMTATGAVLGTPAYMSPEQVQGFKLDGRSDLYSLGIVLYEMLAGVRPFSGGSMISTGLMHMTQPVPPLPPSVEVFQPLIDRLLAKQAEERLQNAHELIEALRNLEDSIADGTDPLLAALYRRAQRDGKPSRNRSLHKARPRRALALSAALFSLLVLATIGVWILTQQNSEPLETPAGAIDSAALTSPATRPEEQVAARRAAEEQEAARRAAEEQAAARRAAEARRLQRIESLLADAAERVAEAGSSIGAARLALASLEPVLKIDPDNATAVSARDSVLQQILALADRAVVAENFTAAEEALNLARRESPNHEGIPPLVSRLAEARRNARERLDEERRTAEAEAARARGAAAAEEADQFLLPGF